MTFSLLQLIVISAVSSIITSMVFWAYDTHQVNKIIKLCEKRVRLNHDRTKYLERENYRLRAEIESYESPMPKTFDEVFR